jgi:hypothetical protein
MFLLFSFVAFCVAQNQNSSSEPPYNVGPCSEKSILEFISSIANLQKAQTTAQTAADSEGIADVRLLTLDNLVLSCANVAPYDTTVKRFLLKFLQTDVFPLVRGEAAADIKLLNKAKEYYRDPEIIKALTTAMRHDGNAVVRVESAHTLVSFCHLDTSEVRDTLISIATKVSEPSSLETENPCPKCPSHSSKLRMGAVKGLAAKEFYGDGKIINALQSLSSDSDDFVKKTATTELNYIMGHHYNQKKGGQ